MPIRVPFYSHIFDFMLVETGHHRIAVPYVGFGYTFHNHTHIFNSRFLQTAVFYGFAGIIDFRGHSEIRTEFFRVFETVYIDDHRQYLNRSLPSYSRNFGIKVPKTELIYDLIMLSENANWAYEENNNQRELVFYFM